MSDAPVEAAVAGDAEAGLGEDRARRPLIWVVILASIATISGTFVFSYPSTLESIRRAMILVHDVSGDLLIAAGVVYLYFHLKRTWRMWKRVLSRWSGYVAVSIWLIAAVTGVQGQLDALVSGTLTWRAHLISTVALIVVGGFHAAVGLRRRFKAERR